MKPYLIRFWHGMPSGDSPFLQKVKRLCRTNEQNNVFWDGTLNEFEYVWRDKFMLLPPQEEENMLISGRICITDKSNFGAH